MCNLQLQCFAIAFGDLSSIWTCTSDAMKVQFYNHNRFAFGDLYDLDRDFWCQKCATLLPQWLRRYQFDLDTHLRCEEGAMLPPQ